jgi:hypothetical protein
MLSVIVIFFSASTDEWNLKEFKQIILEYLKENNTISNTGGLQRSFPTVLVILCPRIQIQFAVYPELHKQISAHGLVNKPMCKGTAGSLSVP